MHAMTCQLTVVSGALAGGKSFEGIKPERRKGMRQP